MEMDGFTAATRLGCMKYHATEAPVDTIEDLMTSNLLRVFNERDEADGGAMWQSSATDKSPSFTPSSQKRPSP